jgi:hypothetical protein
MLTLENEDLQETFLSNSQRKRCKNERKKKTGRGSKRRETRVEIEWIGYLMKVAPLVAEERLTQEVKEKHGLVY